MKTYSAEISSVALMLLVVAVACQSGRDASQRLDVGRDRLYVMAGGTPGGDGTRARPFNSLAQAQSASDLGDTIVLMSARDDAVLDGGMVLKHGQRLLGLHEDGTLGTADVPAVRLTNSTEHLDGVIVELAGANEIAGLQLDKLHGHGIYGAGESLSGTRIHHTRITGAIESDELIVGILLEPDGGDTRDVVVHDCIIEDGEDLAGIRVMHTNDSTGEYAFARNRFANLGGRAYLIWSRGTSHIRSTILDSAADNIGRGNRNADSIDPRLWGRSEQHMTVRNYRYRNSGQVGNRSNTGFEAFIMGEPFRDAEEWCNGCKLTLAIEDSVFECTVTDGIQLTNYGTNTELNVAIRNTKVLNSNPQQAGGAISLIAQNQYNRGSHAKLLVENCDLVNSGRYGVAILDRSGEYCATVDLGGGDLGSRGQNRVVGSAERELLVVNANPTAQHNWWGGNPPRIEIDGADSTVDLEPALTRDPRDDS